MARHVVDVDERREVIQRFARLHPSGRPVFCTPSQAELAGEIRRVTAWGNDGKVVFDSLERAEACARVLESIGCEPLLAYECKRGGSDHHHLTGRGAAVARERERRGAGRGKRRGARW